MLADGISIAAVLEHYGATVAVSDTGWRSLRCPFHDDSTASASVNLELNGFRCFACNVSGDSISIIKERENLDFHGAVEFARTVLGQSCEGIQPTASRKRKARRSSFDRTLFD